MFIYFNRDSAHRYDMLKIMIQKRLCLTFGQLSVGIPLHIFSYMSEQALIR